MADTALVPRVADLLTNARINAGMNWRDDMVAVDCATCAAPKRLDRCKQVVRDDRRTYVCAGCKEPLLSIRRPYAFEVKAAMHGFLLAGHVLINLGAVRLHGFGRLLFPPIVDAPVMREWLKRITAGTTRRKQGW